jgi:hypothetical protein
MLVPEPAHEVQHYAEHHTEQDRGGKRKVEGRVFAPVNNVAGKTSDRQIGPAQQHQRYARDHNDRAQKNQQFSQIRHNSFYRSGNGCSDICAKALSWPHPGICAC